jgi:hypothetical protein
VIGVGRLITLVSELHLDNFIFDLGNFFLAFRVLKFWGRFDTLNKVFFLIRIL